MVVNPVGEVGYIAFVADNVEYVCGIWLPEIIRTWHDCVLVATACTSIFSPNANSDAP